MNFSRKKKVRFNVPSVVDAYGISHTFGESPIVIPSIKKIYYSLNKKLDYFSYFIFCI